MNVTIPRYKLPLKQHSCIQITPCKLTIYKLKVFPVIYLNNRRISLQNKNHLPENTPTFNRYYEAYNNRTIISAADKAFCT